MAAAAGVIALCGCVHGGNGRCVIESSPSRCAGFVTVGSVEGNEFVFFVLGPPGLGDRGWIQLDPLPSNEVEIDFSENSLVSKLNDAAYRDIDRHGKVRRWEDAEPGIRTRIRGHWSSSKSVEAVLVIDEIDIIGIVPVSHSTLGVTVVKPDSK
jgi:hypothetical protein